MQDFALVFGLWSLKPCSVLSFTQAFCDFDLKGRVVHMMQHSLQSCHVQEFLSLPPSLQVDLPFTINLAGSG